MLADHQDSQRFWLNRGLRGLRLDAVRVYRLQP